MSTHTCKSPPCLEVVERGFYCADCYHQLWDRIQRDAHIVDGEAAETYVGRTAFPERRLLEQLHQREFPYLSILHWTNGLQEADHFEEKLIRDLRRGRKLVNADDRADGKYTGHFHAIYVAWLPKRGASPKTRLPIREVDAFDAGRYAWPSPPPNFETVHLHSSMRSELAKGAVARLVSEQSDYYASTRYG